MQVRLPPSLREMYLGPQTDTQVKCRVSLDNLTGSIHLSELSGGNVPDQKWTLNLLAQLNPKQNRNVGEKAKDFYWLVQTTSGDFLNLIMQSIFKI